MDRACRRTDALDSKNERRKIFFCDHQGQGFEKEKPSVKFMDKKHSTFMEYFLPLQLEFLFWYGDFDGELLQKNNSHAMGNPLRF